MHQGDKDNSIMTQQLGTNYRWEHACIFLYFLSLSAPPAKYFCHPSWSTWLTGVLKGQIDSCKIHQTVQELDYIVLHSAYPQGGLYLLDTLDEDDDALGEVPRALRLHKQRLKTLERTVLADWEGRGTVPSGLNPWAGRALVMMAKLQNQRRLDMYINC